MTENELNKELIHHRFKTLRKNARNKYGKRLSQDDLGDEIGIAQSRISKLEGQDKDTKPSLNDLVTYSSYFGVSIDYLLGLSDEKCISLSNKELFNLYGLTSDSLSNLQHKIDGNMDTLKNIERRNKLLALNFLLSSKSLDLFLDSLFNYVTFNSMAIPGSMIIPYSDDPIFNEEKHSINELKNIFSTHLIINKNIGFYEQMLKNDLIEKIENVKREYLKSTYFEEIDYKNFSDSIDKIFNNMTNNNTKDADEFFLTIFENRKKILKRKYLVQEKMSDPEFIKERYTKPALKAMMKSNKNKDQ